MKAIKTAYRVTALPLFEDNYSYVIQGTDPLRLVLVDPAVPHIVVNFLKLNFPQHVVSHVLYTHKHWDHAGGSDELSTTLKSLFPQVRLVIGKDDKESVNGANYYLNHNEQLTIGRSKVKTIHVPCHTRGHTIYSFLPIEHNNSSDITDIKDTESQGRYINNFDSVSPTFTGDTLFVGGVGKFFEGNAEEMVNNVKNMLDLIQEDSEIFCGHEYTISNLQWSKEVEPQNIDISSLYSKLYQQKESKGQVCSLPSSLKREKLINLFVRTVTGTPLHASISNNPAILMKILREMKNGGVTVYKSQSNL